MADKLVVQMKMSEKVLSAESQKFHKNMSTGRPIRIFPIPFSGFSTQFHVIVSLSVAGNRPPLCLNVVVICSLMENGAILMVYMKTRTYRFHIFLDYFTTTPLPLANKVAGMAC